MYNMKKNRFCFIVNLNIKFEYFNFIFIKFDLYELDVVRFI